jgi:hypothetical protein|uniref:Uncharacterized protein n=1 Tax=Sipha flava TaxID=143950 RepID=A0A2S2Q7Q9_9HEMI
MLCFFDKATCALILVHIDIYEVPVCSKCVTKKKSCISGKEKRKTSFEHNGSTSVSREEISVKYPWHATVAFRTQKPFLVLYLLKMRLTTSNTIGIGRSLVINKI